MIGMHFNDRLEKYPKTDWVRLWDCGVTWKDIHISPTDFDLTMLEHYVNQFSDRKILYVICSTPKWLAMNPNEPHFAPWIGEGSNSLPYDLEYWKMFVDVISSKYKNRIHAYQIWNEPQLVEFMSPWNLKNRNRLAEMTKVANEIIKKNDPNARVISAPILPRKSSGGVRRGKKYFYALKRKGWPVDFISCHIYPEINYGPERWTFYLNKVKEISKKIGGPQKIWITETNYNLLGDIISGEKAKNFVKQTYLNANNYPIFWYTWNKMHEIGGLDLNISGDSWKEIKKN